MKALLPIVTLLASLAGAQGKHATTASPRLVSAKTACIHMLHGTDRDAAAARRELKKWGRYKLVNECEKSDVTILIIARYSPDLDVCGAVVQAESTWDQAILWTGNQKCKTRTDLVVGRLFRRLRADVTRAGMKKAKVAAHPEKARAHSKTSK